MTEIRRDPNLKGRRTVRLNGGFAPPLNMADEEAQDGMIHENDDDIGDVVSLLRDLITVVLQEDFDLTPGAAEYTTCGSCRAFRAGKCRRRAGLHPDRKPTEGCMEGLPVTEMEDEDDG